MRTNYVLIDFESVQPTQLAALDHDHFKVILFVGARQAKLPYEIAAAIQRLGAKVEYIKIFGNGPNALDFHIAFYIGKIVSADPTAYFHIISKDEGFDPLIQQDGYRIPIPELGSDTIWFYPDFILWTKDAIWCIDPKGKHLLDAAIVQKLLDFSGVKNLATPIKVAFVLQGSFVADRQGSWSKTPTQGFTLVRKSTTGPKGYPYSDLQRLVRAFIRD